MTTIETIEMSGTQSRRIREAAVLETIRTIGKPARINAIVAAMPPIPMEIRPGIMEYRQPGMQTVRFTLYRLERTGQVRKTKERTHGRAYLYEVAA